MPQKGQLNQCKRNMKFEAGVMKLEVRSWMWELRIMNYEYWWESGQNGQKSVKNRPI